MSIYAIAATGLNGEIGLRDVIPWQGKLPRDMKHFMQTTRGSAIIMGRVTADTLKLPFATRKSIIVTRKVNEGKERYAHHSEVVSSLDEAIELYSQMAAEGTQLSKDANAFIIGGAQIYRLAMEQDIIERMYLTTVHANFNADASFVFDRTNYKLTSTETHAPDEKNLFGCTFEVYQRR